VDPGLDRVQNPRLGEGGGIANEMTFTIPALSRHHPGTIPAPSRHHPGALRSVSAAITVGTLAVQSACFIAVPIG
jgi:hypothetical protein